MNFYKFYVITAGAYLSAMLTMFIVTFLIAYTNPSKTVLVGINLLGEANIELGLLVYSLPMAIILIKLLANHARNN